MIADIMRILRAIQKTVILCLMVMWAWFFAVHAAESFGCFEGTLEHSQESIEKAFSSPVETISHSAIERPSKTGLFFEWIDCLKDSFKTRDHNFPFWSSFVDKSPPSGAPALFQLFSVYRI